MKYCIKLHNHLSLRKIEPEAGRKLAFALFWPPRRNRLTFVPAIAMQPRSPSSCARIAPLNARSRGRWYLLSLIPAFASTRGRWYPQSLASRVCFDPLVPAVAVEETRCRLVCTRPHANADT